jgi:hypothetical protein
LKVPSLAYNLAAFSSLFPPFTPFNQISPQPNDNSNPKPENQPKTSPPEMGGRVLFTIEMRVLKA